MIGTETSAFKRMKGLFSEKPVVPSCDKQFPARSKQALLLNWAAQHLLSDPIELCFIPSKRFSYRDKAQGATPGLRDIAGVGALPWSPQTRATQQRNSVGPALKRPQAIRHRWRTWCRNVQPCWWRSWQGKPERKIDKLHLAAKIKPLYIAKNWRFNGSTQVTLTMFCAGVDAVHSSQLYITWTKSL